MLPGSALAVPPKQQHTIYHHAGMETGTAAAAAGGSTTVVDMPLNSHPCTTTAQLLQEKMKIAEVRHGA
jgi:dihydroorotase-like cyclic amidohydrolase